MNVDGKIPFHREIVHFADSRLRERDARQPEDERNQNVVHFHYSNDVD
jgi:hypothetical protein